jgi:hypothetical protein
VTPLRETTAAAAHSRRCFTPNISVKQLPSIGMAFPESKMVDRVATLAGLLVAGGHFGGDGRQPQVTVRMHVRHESLFRWLETSFPGSRLYGPYDHGGRQYYQWMARGSYLREQLAPALARYLTPAFDRYSHERFVQMCERYSILLVSEVGSGPEAESDA